MQWAIEPLVGVMASESVPPMNVGAYGGAMVVLCSGTPGFKNKVHPAVWNYQELFKKTLLHGCHSLQPFPQHSTQNWER